MQLQDVPFDPPDPETIKLFRQRHKISQDILAAILGVQRVTVGRWERNERKPDSYLFFALSWMDEHPEWVQRQRNRIVHGEAHNSAS